MLGIIFLSVKIVILVGLEERLRLLLYCKYVLYGGVSTRNRGYL